MKKLTNKEAIQRVKDFLLTQDHDTVCFTLAAVLIDINRLNNYESLRDSEKESLNKRMELNVKQLQKFLKKGYATELKIGICNSDE